MPGSVTIVVPCYNYGRYLRQCVNSILVQDVDLNVDIIDDASTDDTESVGSALASEDQRVTYQRHVRISDTLPHSTKVWSERTGHIACCYPPMTCWRQARSGGQLTCSKRIRTSLCCMEASLNSGTFLPTRPLLRSPQSGCGRERVHCTLLQRNLEPG